MTKFLSLMAVLTFVVLRPFAVEASPVWIDGLYVNSFGDSRNPSLIFVHGGPGHDSWDFELTTARRLSDLGYYVVVYDQRGQGRSLGAAAAEFTYRQYAKDLKNIIQTLSLEKPVLLGHSHGGPIALMFDRLHPGVARSIVLVGAPINFWAGMKTMRENCASRYLALGKLDALTDLDQVFSALDDQSVAPQSQVNSVARAFSHGVYCGLYSTSAPTPQAQFLRGLVNASPLQVSQENKISAMPGFLINEGYIRFDHSSFVRENAHRIFGIYGLEDGLFSPAVLRDIESALSDNPSLARLQLIPGASHAVYIDQQDWFLSAIQNVLSAR